METDPLRTTTPATTTLRAGMLTAVLLFARLLNAPSSARAQSSGAAPRAAVTMAPSPTHPQDSGPRAVPGPLPLPAGSSLVPAVSQEPASRVTAPAVIGTSVLATTLSAAVAPIGYSVSLPTELNPQPGGLTEASVASRALRHAPSLRAATASVAAARAQQIEVGMQFIPTLNLSFRYTRLSDYEGSQIPVFDSVSCVTNFAHCQANAQSYSQVYTLSPTLLDQYALRGSMIIALSDIPLRLVRQYQAAGLLVEAKKLDAAVTEAQTVLLALESFYEYLRAIGQLAVARQSAESANRRVEELRHSVAAGVASRAELLRAEASASALTKVLLLGSNSLALSEAQLRQRLHLDPQEPIVNGEALDSPLPSEADAESLIRDALLHRSEVASLSQQAQSLRMTRASFVAALLPSLSALGNVDYANPNPRIFPQTGVFQSSWDVTLAVSWSPNQAAMGAAAMAQLEAKRQLLLAQIEQVRDAIELEVRAALHGTASARAQVDSARAQLAAAEESHRARSLRFSQGGATHAELRETELELLRARLGVLNAYVDLRLAHVRLKRACGARPGSARSQDRAR